MTSPNHIVGGIAITGISLSFWDINIFSNEAYLILCIFSSLLPDIDHTKSIIGKIFYPLAKYLDRKFGHRTFTHSLSFMIPLFIFFLFIELNLINPYFERSGTTYSLIFLFAFFSHLILDMLTIQGIPLFYPFMKNPCVIPANPTLRFKSGNIKSEAIALFIFTFVLFTFYDLFKNGFWTTYNRSFGTIRHAYREFKESEYIVKVSYEYSFNGNKESGEGYILEASKEMVELWTNNGITKRILKIDSEDLRFKNISIKPSKTNTKYSVKDFKFFNLTIEEINDTLNNKIVSGKILSSNKFIVNQYKVLKNSIELNKEISPKFQWLKNDTLKKVIANKIEVKKAKLYDIQNDNFKEKQKLQLLKNSLNQYKIDLKNASNIYDKNKFEKLIIQVKKKINNFNLNLKNVNYLVQEINILKRELNYNQEHYFTGDLKIFSVPGETSNLIVDNK
jgi:membrane-bound metal-dependent hydrolase YbcI (DUF457 family)